MSDFGRLAEIISAAAAASYNRNTGPIAIGPAMSTSNYNFGSLGTSLIMHNEVYGDLNEFLWSVHTWDDRIHIVN